MVAGEAVVTGAISAGVSASATADDDAMAIVAESSSTEYFTKVLFPGC
jgi:hypothetical protein